MKTKDWKKQHKQEVVRIKKSYNHMVRIVLSLKPELKGKGWIPVKPYKMDGSISWKKRVSRLGEYGVKINGFLSKKIQDIKSDKKLTNTQKRFLKKTKNKKGVIITSVPGTVKGGGSFRSGDLNVIASTPVKPTDLEFNKTILGLIKEDRKLAAVKAVKENCGCGLFEAKKYVLELCSVIDKATLLMIRGERVSVAKCLREFYDCGLYDTLQYVNLISDKAIVNPVNNMEFDKELIDTVRSGKKLAAVKKFKNKHNCSLKEAKDYVDDLI